MVEASPKWSMWLPPCILHLVHDTCMQLGEKALQTVHQTFEPDKSVILHLPALTNTTTHTDTVPTLLLFKKA